MGSLSFLFKLPTNVRSNIAGPTTQTEKDARAHTHTRPSQAAHERGTSVHCLYFIQLYKHSHNLRLITDVLSRAHNVRATKYSQYHALQPTSRDLQ